MKNILTVILAAIVSLGWAQDDITKAVSDAIKKGDATAVAAHFMPQVELNIADQEDTYPAADAKVLLAKFFSLNVTKDFVVKHQGTSKLNDQYRIGELITAKGTFRVTFFMKKNGNTMQIKQLKIENPGE